MLEQILNGTERGPKRDAVLLNASAALVLSGATKSISEGWDFAIELIASGKAAGKLDELRHARFE